MKKTICFLTGALSLISINAWSANSETVSKAEFNALKRKVAQLEKELDKKQTKPTSPAPKDHSNTATSTKKPKLTRLFVEDGYHGTTFWEAEDNVDFPRVVLNQRNDYSDEALALGGFIELEPINSWWGNLFRNENIALPNPLNKTGTLEAPAPANYSSGNAIGLSEATIDFMINAGHWTQAFFETDVADGAEILSAFVTIGNLESSPFYFTVGKFRTRFGIFPGGPWISSIPQGLFRPGHTFNAMLGFSNENWNGYLVYMPAIDGQSQNAMGSLFYTGHLSKNWSFEVNAGYMTNILTSGNEVGETLEDSNAKATPAVSTDASLTYKNVSVSGGWMSTLRNAVVTNNKEVAMWWTGLGYTIKMFATPVSFGVNYSKVSNAQNIPMPLAGDVNHEPSLYGVKEVVFGYVDTSITRNILVGLEYGRMTTYNSEKTNEITGYTAFYF